MREAFRYVVATALVLAFLLAVTAWSSIRPSAERDWAEPHMRAPRAHIDGSRATISDVRNFEFDSSGPTLLRWDERTYNLDELASVWYIVTPFDTDWRGPAHAFLSFGFDDGRFLAVSIEARRERGEEYSMVRGLLKRYEVIYIIGDERDLIGARVWAQQDELYLYPVRATRAAIRTLFLDVLERANAIADHPEFYGTLRNNCTTAILDHVNAVLDRPIKWGPRVLLPGYSDALALRHGLLDTELSLEEARARFHANERIRRFAAAPDFSARIRETPDPDGEAEASR
jgi:hypothetical protein